MVFLKRFYVSTSAETDLIPITHDIRYALRDAGINEGLASVVVTESGAGITLSENLPAVLDELRRALELFPGEGVHALTRKKEALAVGPRVKAAMLGRMLSIPFTAKELLISQHEDVFLIDFESTPKRREVVIQIMGDKPATPPPGPQGGR
ncbi:MAG: YjbQ family protein [Deltaproteobacteria bacterium]|nr:YjbQ family protein [Deltaproteobacteria bacterium]